MTLIPSDYVTIAITVPITHAEHIRDILGRTHAGSMGKYSHCSFSCKGVGRFLPSAAAHPHIGTRGTLESVEEEYIQTVCHLSYLDAVLEAIKTHHPYEETVIDIYPIYHNGIKQVRP